MLVVVAADGAVAVASAEEIPAVVAALAVSVAAISAAAAAAVVGNCVAMFQKDFMLNEARKFAELLAKLMGLKVESNYAEFDRQLSDILQKEYDANLENLLALSESEFIKRIQSETYSVEKLMRLASYCICLPNLLIKMRKHNFCLKKC